MTNTRMKLPAASMPNHPVSYRQPLTVLFALLLVIGNSLSTAAHAKKCLYISSYHQGYAWSDGVERGLRSVLEEKCELKQFDMDTKRKKSDEHKQAIALEAKQLIESWKPDVVITADDNAAKYIIQPYFKDHEIPFVFCGVNWTAAEYGFPYKNVTGMVEVAPIYPLLEKVQELNPGARKGIYIGANTFTEKKNLARFEKATSKLKLDLDSALADSVAEWLQAYDNAQQYDFIVVGSNSGIADWDQKQVVDRIMANSKILSVTNHDWMMPYTMLGFTKVPEEHGEWAAQAALSIMDGVAVSQIAIVPNRKWDIWTNQGLLRSSAIDLPKGLILKSKQVE